MSDEISTTQSGVAGEQVMAGYSFQDGTQGSWRVVSATGEIDLLAAPALKERLLGAINDTAGPVAVDLSGASFLDSSGLGAILSAFRRANELGRGFAVVAQARPIMNVLTLTGLDKVLEVRSEVSELE
jgi:anti-sigma B factor antagonist